MTERSNQTNQAGSTPSPAFEFTAIDWRNERMNGMTEIEEVIEFFTRYATHDPHCPSNDAEINEREDECVCGYRQAYERVNDIESDLLSRKRKQI